MEHRPICKISVGSRPIRMQEKPYRYDNLTYYVLFQEKCGPYADEYLLGKAALVGRMHKAVGGCVDCPNVEVR